MTRYSELIPITSCLPTILQLTVNFSLRVDDRGCNIVHGSQRRVSNRARSKVMKAAVVPAMSSSWLIKDVPQPQPGPGQVLVKMHASGICYTHVHQTLGHLPGPFPRILGHEPVGEIVATAPDGPHGR